MICPAANDFTGQASHTRAAERGDIAILLRPLGNQA